MCADSAFRSTTDQYAACVRLREVDKEEGRQKEEERWDIYTDVI